MPTTLTNSELTTKNGALLKVVSPSDIVLNVFDLTKDVNLITNAQGDW